MAKEILKIIEEAETIAKEEFEKTQKFLQTKVEAFKDKIQNDYNINLNEIKEEYSLKLEKEKNELYESLKPKLKIAQKEANNLKNKIDEKKDEIVNKLKDVIMKG